MDKVIKYSCDCDKPLNYSLLNEDKPFPKPKDGSNTYYWHIGNYTTDVEKYRSILVFEKVLNMWQRGVDSIAPVGNYLNFQSTDDIRKADFVFSFGHGFHTFHTSQDKRIAQCHFAFNGKGGVLAHAFDYNQPAPYGGTMHLDDAENFLKMLYAKIVAHEFGHILGVGHSNDPKALMYGRYNENPMALSDDDLNALQARLGPIKEQFAPEEKEEPVIEATTGFLNCLIKYLEKFIK